MAKKTLVAHTYAMKDGKAVWFEPGDTVPDWAAGQLTNPKLYEDGGEKAAGPEEGGGAQAPPRSGRGSGVEAWRAFAQGHGVGLDDGMSREDIIAACEQAGLVEQEE
jgi:hypothetical protein